MNRIPWAAVAWFSFSASALVMAISAFRSPLHRTGLQAPQSLLPPRPGVQFKQARPSQTHQPDSAGIVHHPSGTLLQQSVAGVRLLKCVVNGQVTYTNNPQDCPTKAASSVTVYPTQGYLPTNP
ncbi:MAG: hypothetical protein HKL99_09885 [Burkholderiales bacterium]|jgi:hypothetical protein|nr:hypothetical protein [Burkholderiales bacterium]